MLVRRKNKKLEEAILSEQNGYEKLRKQAYRELLVLEEYFGRRKVDQISIYLDIKKHLEASQKYTSYTGYRGVFLGLITTIFVYMLTTGVLNKLFNIRLSLDNYFSEAIALIIVTPVIVLTFLAMYFLGTIHFFLDDRKRRKQLYINEYMIMLLAERIAEIIDNR